MLPVLVGASGEAANPGWRLDRRSGSGGGEVGSGSEAAGTVGPFFFLPKSLFFYQSR